MTPFQKTVKYLAIALAIFLAVSIIGGIITAVGTVGGIFFGGNRVGDNKSYEVGSGITRLEIKINAAELAIKEGEKYAVESNLKHLAVKEEDGTLKITENKKLGGSYNGALLTLTIPKDTELDAIKLEVGAGSIRSCALTAKKADISAGASETEIDSLTVTVGAKLQSGAGELTIKGGSLTNANIGIGVGELDLTSSLLGNTELELGVGESNITVLGKRADYCLKLEKGIGAIKLDGEKVSSLNESTSADNTLKIEGGIGAINLSFSE